MKFFEKFLLRAKYLAVDKQNVLMTYIEYGIIKDVKKIIEIIDDVNFYDYKKGETPLTLAIKNKNLEIIKLLIEHGADVNLKKYSLVDLPLICAVKHGDKEVVRCLLDNGAKINLAGRDGSTALNVACSIQDYTRVRREGERIRITYGFFDKKKIIAHLIKRGANLSSVDNKGKTALMHTLDSINIEEKDYLINKMLEEKGYVKHKNILCVGINLDNYHIEERELEYINNDVWYKWQKVKREELSKAIEIIKNVDSNGDVNKILQKQKDILNAKIAESMEKCYYYLNRADRERFNSTRLKKAIQRKITQTSMTPAVALNMIQKIDNMQEIYSKNADKQELINILKDELKKVSKILEMVENLKARVELGSKREVLNVVGLCKEKGIGNLNNRIEQINKEKQNKTKSI